MQVGVQLGEFGDVAAVELGRVVELGVAQAGGVGADALDPRRPAAPGRAWSGKCVGWAQLTM